MRVIAKLALTLTLLSCLIAGGAGYAYATQAIYSNWSARYPGSLADDRMIAQDGQICRLCHYSTYPLSWNGYGWALKNAKKDFAAVEGFNSDQDSGGYSNLEEITAGAQPGWTGGNNTIYNWNSTLGAAGAPSVSPLDIFVDTEKPTASFFSPDYASGVSKTDDFKVSWTGSDSGSGVANYTTQYKVGLGGTWTSWKTDTTAKSAIFDGSVGRTYYFRARAKDKVGNTGNWSTTNKTVVPSDQGVFSASGVWASFTDSNLYKGTSKRSSSQGAKLAKSFSGAKSIALIVTKRPNGGYAKVYIGTTLIKTIDLYSSSIKYRQAILIKSSTTSFSGMLKVVVKGAHQPGSSGNRVEVDGLGITN